MQKISIDIFLTIEILKKLECDKFVIWLNVVCIDNQNFFLNNVC